MYIAICDDETAFLEQILSFCLHWEAESGFTLQKKIFHSAEELLDKIINFDWNSVKSEQMMAVGSKVDFTA